MANKHKGEVSVEIDGKEYKLKLTSNALATAEMQSGVGSLFDVENLGFATVRALFFAACKSQLKNIDEAGELMDSHFTAIVDAVAEAYSLFFQGQIEHISE